MSARVLFYVQHLLGVGHVFRAKRIVEALVERGGDVAVVLGGRDIPHLRFDGAAVHQLPAIHAGDADFGNLVTSEGAPLSNAFRAHRRDALMDVLGKTSPDVILTEAYPFARRSMRFELIPFLEAAHRQTPRPLILASIRDILQRPSSEKKAQEACDVFERLFDGALVHGDPDFARVDESYPALAAVADRLHYTGIVAPPLRTAPDQVSAAANTFDVVVSAGGGAVGGDVIRAAIAAKSKTLLADANWLVLTGPNLPKAERREIDEMAASAGVTVETFRSDLPALVAAARISIQQAGYNTVADVLRTDTAAVLVPYAIGGETEQTDRAHALERLGRAAVVTEEDLNSATMAAAIARALAAPSPHLEINLDGASTSAEIVARLLARHRNDAPLSSA